VLQGADAICFVATTDLAPARAFYEGKLGLRVVDANPGACVFDAHGTMLRVTLVEKVAVAPYTVLGWAVSDIESTIDALIAAGVTFERYGVPGQDERGVWIAPGGDRVAWFRDPDGNTLSLTQFR
jgi:catechol 2,3-dioxygenase-like lactoylglutathione lyase family enzyme